MKIKVSELSFNQLLLIAFFSTLLFACSPKNSETVEPELPQWRCFASRPRRCARRRQNHRSVISNDPAWTDRSLRRLATSLALVDHRRDTPQRWLFDATPDIKEQLHALNEFAPTDRPARVDGVFLTHGPYRPLCGPDDVRP